MKPQRLFGIVVLAVFAAAVFLWLNRSSPPPQADNAGPAPESSTSSPTAQIPGSGVSETASPRVAPTTSPPPSAAPLPSTTQPAVLPNALGPADALPTPDRLRADIEDVQLTLRDFRTGLGGNPVGNNAEITKALLGDNLKQLKLTVPTGSQLNNQGELCDRFGTPYFFHQVSASKMEIRSAGVDRQMWTADDVQR